MKKILGFLGAALISACGVRSCGDVNHPAAYEITNFVPVSQPDDITCGPACVAAVAGWCGRPCTVREAEKYTKTKWFESDKRPVGMTVPDYIAIALKDLGVPATLRRGNLNNLKYYVSRNRPPVVLVRTADDTWHYVVVVGYTTDRITYADPAGGVRTSCPTAHFVGAWEFRTDLDGIICGLPCPLCGGAGRYGWGAGCDVCGGDRVLDPLVHLLQEAEVHPRTMIVPDL